MKACVQWNPIYDCKAFRLQRGVESGTNGPEPTEVSGLHGEGIKIYGEYFILLKLSFR